MKICSIITEYNPFHAGHAYQIAQIRQKYPDIAIAAVMSGCYVQRGAPALWDKYSRAAFAVQAGGPDLVLELPIQAALSSAEGFARGGVQLIHAMGCTTHLSFGCESGTEASLMQLAAHLNTAEFQQLLQQHLQTGISYAQAASLATQTLCPNCAALLDSPNDTLAVQYCRAIQEIAPSIQPIAIRRKGAAHDGTPEDGIPSASHIRSLFCEQPEQAFAFVPDSYREASRTLRRHSWSDMEAAVLPYLRRLTPEDIAKLPNVSEGLEHRFYAACQSADSLESLWEQARSRRHPLSRIRRLTMCAYLGLTQELADLPPAFLTVLAANTRGRTILKQMRSTCSLPLIVKPTQARQLTGTAKRLWEFTVRADDLYSFPAPAGTDWKQTPYIEK